MHHPRFLTSRPGSLTVGALVAVSMVGLALLALGVGFVVTTYGGPTIASDH